MNGESRSAWWKKGRLWAWQVAHFWEYWPEIKWFFWGIRLRLSLWRDRLAGRTPLLGAVTVWGHRTFVLPIMEELRKRSGKYSFYLIVDQKEGLPEGDLLGIPRWRVRSYRDYLPFGKKFAAMLAADIYWRHPPSPCPLIVCLDHGLPSKLLHYSRAMGEQYTHIFAYGPSHREVWETIYSQFPDLKAHLTICDVGYPRADEILARRGQRREILERFHLDPSKPTVLYAPAFNRGGALERYGRAVFDALAGMEDVNVIVKLHPVSYDMSVVGAHSQGIYWPDVVDQYCKPGFFHAGNVDVTDCLVAADVMVDDISGVAFEFYFLDRPVVYLESPGYFQSIGAGTNGDGNWLVNVGRSAGVEVGDMASMCAAIRHAIANPMEKSPQRRELVKRLLYNPGRGTVVAADTLERLLAEQRKT